MSVGLAPLLRGSATQSTGVANGIATATVAAVTAVTHLALGVEAHYDVSVTVIKDVTVTYNGITLTFRWDFTNGPFVYSFPVALSGADSGAVSATIAASGAGGTTGYVTLFTAAK